MKNRRTPLKLAGLALLFASSSVLAIPVVGTTGGSFSNLSSCDSSGGDVNCAITSTSNGSATQVQWGSTSLFSNLVNPSTLTAVDTVINTNTNSGAGVVLGQLDWYNSATYATSDLDVFNVRWTLALAFTSPNGPDGSGSEAFDLSISNPINPLGDSLYGLGLADLTGLRNSFSLNGVSVSNLRYAVTDGAGSGTSYLNNGVWYNSEYNWSSLRILADFGNSTPVPEPGTLAMFGIGLLGAAFASKTRRRKQLQTA